jgi:predicted Rossmann fold flavoprotein
LCDSTDIAIVGAGAAGLATAIFTRRLNPHRSITIFDGARKPGAKILVSGGGRCNVTNASVSERDFSGGSATLIRRILRALPVPETVQFFAGLGVPLHEEAHGKLFPDSNRSRDVLDALLREIERLDVTIAAGRRVIDVVRRSEGFVVVTNEGETPARRAVIATGGRALPKSGSDGAGYAMAASLGHTIIDTTPALAPLVLEPHAQAAHTQLIGVAHDVEITLRIDRRVARRLNGALLWTHFGVSGPAALDASRHWARAHLDRRQVELTLSACPGLSFEQVDERLVSLAAARPRAAVPTLLASFLPASVAGIFAADAGIPATLTAGRLTRDDRRRLTHGLTGSTLRVLDTRGYTYAEATAGGVALDEIDPATMESRRCAGLFLVGEVLDVDGRLGGFNFQWAWSSAKAAARGLSR